MGSEVLIPCPISGFFEMIVTAPSAAILMNGLGEKAAAPAASAASADSKRPMRSPPPARAETLRKERRSTTIVSMSPPYRLLAIPSRVGLGTVRVAAFLIASRIRRYVAHRQRLPAIAASMSSSEGLGVDLRSAAAVMICPA